MQAAHLVRLARRWTPSELERARLVGSDPRIAAALRAADRFGVSEVLAAGPELLETWGDAWAPKANPRGAALVAAALDCRRAGLVDPVPQEWLRVLHRRYLEARGGGDLQPEPFDEALAWACKAVHASSSLLVGNYSQGYAAFDYLLDSPELEPVPDHLREGLLPLITPVQAYDVGLGAYRDSKYAIARRALAAARDATVPGADFALAVVTGDSGHPAQAVRALSRIAEQRTRTLGPDHPDSLAARHQRAYFTGIQGRVEKAAEQFRSLAADCARTLGPDHSDTLAARHQLAYFTGESGHPEIAVRQLEQLVADRRRISGLADPQTIAARRSLAWYLGQSGRSERALADLTSLRHDAELALGAEDAHTLAIRVAIAQILLERGEARRAAALLSVLVSARSRVLGADHPHTLFVRLQHALALAKAGDRAEALVMLQCLCSDAARCLDVGHPHAKAVREALDRVRSGGGPARRR